MPKNWKWDAGHVIILLAFVAGCAWKVANVVGQGFDFNKDMPAFFLLAMGVAAFWKNPPNNPSDALQQGEGMASKRGMARVSIVGWLTLVGVLLMLVCAPRVGKETRVSSYERANIVMLGQGCIQTESTAQQMQDFANAELCIQSHWGEPIAQLAGDCVGGIVATAEDIVADIEAIAEGEQILKGQSADATAVTFPYKDDQKVLVLVQTKRAAYLTHTPIPRSAP